MCWQWRSPCQIQQVCSSAFKEGGFHHHHLLLLPSSADGTKRPFPHKHTVSVQSCHNEVADRHGLPVFAIMLKCAPSLPPPPQCEKGKQQKSVQKSDRVYRLISRCRRQLERWKKRHTKAQFKHDLAVPHLRMFEADKVAAGADEGGLCDGDRKSVQKTDRVYRVITRRRCEMQNCGKW